MAVVGPNADRAVIMGGGSAHVEPAHLTSPLAALRAHLGDAVEVVHQPGVDITRAAVTVRGPVHAALSVDGEVVRTEVWPAMQMVTFGPPEEVGDDFTVRATSPFTPARTGPHDLRPRPGRRGPGHRRRRGGARRHRRPAPTGPQLPGLRLQGAVGTVDLEAGEEVEVVVEYRSEGADGVHGVRVGVRAALPDDALDRAVAAAAEADVAVVVVGTDDEWESEGFDRRTMDLPGDQEELVRPGGGGQPPDGGGGQRRRPGDHGLGRRSRRRSSSPGSAARRWGRPWPGS